jgi:hypothetical protein
MDRLLGLTWMSLLALAAAGCGNDPKIDTVPWTPLDLSHRQEKTTVIAEKPPRSPEKVSDSAWAPPSNVPARPWKYIVIHHSVDEGNAETFDAAHRAKGWDCLGYDFVIDNGNGGPNGRVEVGPRWKQQKWGAHCKTADNAYNNYGIGICLVGNFTSHMPSQEQLASLDKLVRYLMATYDIPAESVIGHRDAPGAKTECPGDCLHTWIHKTLRPSLKQVAKR